VEFPDDAVSGEGAIIVYERSGSRYFLMCQKSSLHDHCVVVVGRLIEH
jgi:hypothetical protein